MKLEGFTPYGTVIPRRRRCEELASRWAFYRAVAHHTDERSIP